MAISLETSIQYLKGVGPKLAEFFSRKGISSIQEFVEFFPRSYEDQRQARNIASLQPGETVSLKAQIVKISSIPLGKSSRKIYDVTLKDASGMIHCKFFRVPYRGYFERFTPLKEVRIVGEVKDYRGRLEFHHPDIRDIEPNEELKDQLIPLYTEIEGFSSNKTLKLIRQAIAQVEKWPDEQFPSWVLEKYQLMTRKEALQDLHLPRLEWASQYLEFKAPSQRRIIFEEFFWLELFLAARKSGLQREKGPIIQNNGQWTQEVQKNIPFKLTQAQVRSFEEIKKDLEGPHPMNRLVQGDVGSGKTLVCLLACTQAAQSGYQSCLMVPTEILAEQHLKNAVRYLGSKTRVGLLTGKTKTSERKEILEKLQNGEIDLLIGTHALLEDWVQFRNLGLVVIDEQHRFGVEQRGALKVKGSSPHFLVMTATPIPRTLAMTVYGDLEVSIIDELPPGRSPIQTRVAYQSKRIQALEFMRDQIKKGRQAYIIYPLVEESEKMDLKNAVDEYEELQSRFPDLKFGLLHGKMKPQEKDEVMEKFRAKEFDVLISTTVIEVGVDVPNSTVMIVEHSERFGLSQLHQLRGRVGRGEHKSYCILLLGYAVSDEARQRVEFMEKTTDGFKIAEFDLEMRGPGEFMGTRQSGLAGFKMAHLVRDFQILLQAREAAFEVLKKDPQLKKSENQSLREQLFKAHGPAAMASIS